MDPTPLMLVGDGPQEPTGLGRIHRDLGWQLAHSDLPIDLCSVGGPIPPVWRHWPHYPMGEAERAGDWGATYVAALWASHYGARPGILWHIWDGSRVAAYAGVQAPVRQWAYSAVDASNRLGGLSGPAGEALRKCDRVLAYGRWASTVLRSVRASVAYLPHGFEPAAYAPVSEEERAWARAELGPSVKRDDLVLGCIATNQPRKDLGLFFQTLSDLAGRGLSVYGWLHTDVLVKAWSIPQLVEDCQLAKRVTVSMTAYTDRQLAALYQACDVTIAPGLGEGFGYPIVESLANGVPVVHGDCGGGRELIPKREWRIPVREVRLEGCYALQRPVFRAEDAANAVERAIGWKNRVGHETTAEYCRGAVAHLAWSALWGRWHAWVKAGL